LYFEIQSLNEYARIAEALQAAMAQLVTACDPKMRTRSTALMLREEHISTYAPKRAGLTLRWNGMTRAPKVDDIIQENETLKKRLTELTAEAANNESILKRTQAASSRCWRRRLPQLLHALVDGLKSRMRSTR